MRSIHAALALVASLVSVAQPGSLDPTFGGDGLVNTLFGSADYGRAVVVQPDGRAVVGGAGSFALQNDFCLARYMPDGSLDNSFNGIGRVATDLFDYDDAVYAIALQPDGKIVAAGSSNVGLFQGIGIARYNANGTLDTDFAGGVGYLRIEVENLASTDAAYAVAVQDDGHILIAGSSNNGMGTTRLLVMRFNTDGTLDTGFDGDGMLVTNVGSGNDVAYAIHTYSDGTFLVGGTAAIFSSFQFMVAKITSTGAFDTNFGSNGSTVVPVGGNNFDQAYNMTVLNDGRIVLVGASLGASNLLPAMAAFNTDGTPWTTFGANGSVIFSMAAPGDYQLFDALVQPDNRIVAVGQHTEGGYHKFFVMRTYPNAIPDPTFGTNGLVEFTFFTVFDEAYSCAWDPSGKIVVAGTTSTGGIESYDFGVARLYSGLEVGVDEVAVEAHGVNVFPMPAHDRITIACALDRSANVRIVLMDALGRRALDQDLGPRSAGALRETVLLPTSLAVGTYFLELRTDESRMVVPVVVE